MSTKSPLSTICLVACANRASSRSIGGMLKKPGRKSTMPHSSRNTIARKWLAVAKSNAASQPAAGIRPVFQAVGLLQIAGVA
jgi:hypothetical protein